MPLDRLPLFERLESSRRVLVAGMGGGYDVFCGLPLFFQLRASGKDVYLANLSFSNLSGIPGHWLTPTCIEVVADSLGPAYYFPERFLAEWFRERGNAQSIFCFARSGVVQLAEAYRALAREYDIDAVVLVDGGTDSLMRGDEPDLGTPQEDLCSLAAVDSLDVEQKLLVCIGFGIDRYHGISHACFLENVAALTKSRGFLGAFSLPTWSEEAELYRQAAAFVFGKMPHHPSIVSSSILSALAGEFGDYHATHRTRGSTLWINPIMAMYWAFVLDAVAKRCLYLDQIRDTESYIDLHNAIVAFRKSLSETRPWMEIPL